MLIIWLQLKNIILSVYGETMQIFTLNRLPSFSMLHLSTNRRSIFFLPDMLFAIALSIKPTTITGLRVYASEWPLAVRLYQPIYTNIIHCTKQSE